MNKILTIMTIALSLWANDFDQGVEDFNKGDYIKALNTFYMLAKQDDDKSQYNVGLIYANGLGVTKDLTQAQTWYEKAAKQGNAKAQYNLAQLYQVAGEEDPHAYEKAKYWYEKAVEAGVVEAYNNLGTLFLEGLGAAKDEEKAFELFQQGAAKGDASAKLNAAILYAWGDDVSHDKMKAYENLKQALKKGKSEASEYLDKLCQESTWVCKD